MQGGRIRVGPACLLAFLTLFSACGRSNEQITVYRLAKPSGDTPQPQVESFASINGADRSSVERAPVTSSNISIPPNWKPQPLSQMRLASFLVEGDNGTVADISFVSLGAAAGNVLDNVNRWLGQLSQSPITAEKLTSTIQKISTDKGEIDVVDLSGKPENDDAKKDGRIVAAIAVDTGGTAFYKMRGNSALVGAEKEKFLQWVRSSRSADVTASAMDDTPATSATIKIKWDLPDNWLPGAPSPMRYASFTTGTDKEKADISVVTFPGDGGNDLDNVNRWRQQIGLPPIEANALESMISQIAGNELRFSMVDMSGETSRTIAGWIRHEGRAWFFKLTGSKEAVEREKPKFVTFIRSVRL